MCDAKLEAAIYAAVIQGMTPLDVDANGMATLHQLAQDADLRAVAAKVQALGDAVGMLPSALLWTWGQWLQYDANEWEGKT